MSEGRVKGSPGAPATAQRTQALAIVVVALIAALGLSLWFSPGLMSTDSVYQWAQVIGREPVSNFHPPLMVYVWKALTLFGPNPGVFLTYEQVLYWLAGAALSLVLVRRALPRLMLLPVICLWPPLLITSLHVWKDVGMLTGLLLACAALIAYQRTRQPGLAIAAAAALFYASLIRYNGVIPALPLVAYLGVVAARAVRARRPVVTVVAVVVAFLGVTIAGQKLLDIGVQHVDQLGPLLVWDIAAVSVATDQDLLPPYVEVTVPRETLLAELKASFSETATFPMWTVIPPDPEFPGMRLVGDWFATIIAHPLAYLGHRARVAALLLGLSDPVYYPWQNGIQANELGLKFAVLTDDGVDLLRRFVYPITQSVFYRVWIYVIAAIGILIAMIARHRKRHVGLAESPYALAATIAASALLSMASLFVLSPAGDFRYGIWQVAGTLVALLLALAPSSAQRTVPGGAAI